MKIAFDLDGVLCNKPPIIPRFLIEYLFCGSRKKELCYRFPKTKIEQQIRKLSHFYLFRPPIKAGFNLLKKYPKDQIFLVSARYSFLEKETYCWLEKQKIRNYFQDIFLNTNNDQPHLFKEKIVQQLKPDLFIEDDPLIARYLQTKFPDLKINR